MTFNVTALEGRYGISRWKERRNDLGEFHVEAVDWSDLLARLKNRHGFRHLCFFTAVDRLEQQAIELVCMLRNHDIKEDLAVKCSLDRNNPVCESIHGHWAAAATYQRELREMYGVQFPDCPRVDEDFCLEGWEGPPPMRRDFDTRRYSEETYFPRPGRSTDDPAEKMRRELYPGRADL